MSASCYVLGLWIEYPGIGDPVNDRLAALGDPVGRSGTGGDPGGRTVIGVT
jgi:hypothetical protein